ncbi:hypothetical protein [Methylocystis echinoides]|uniref:Uncharacterized protein n=1 Tax=Methylocystis echinoides TaxID=29468 RepID=A0A9W6GZN5_9HYPH|nr:hypothetical protein [Methylocystis echinoides]GLI95800.1 hypothetical protein LMG27198_47920 [Methylocystis echinoides]
MTELGRDENAMRLARELGDFQADAAVTKPLLQLFMGEETSPPMTSTSAQRFRAPNDRDPAVGWALGPIIPEFGDLARPIKRTINHATRRRPSLPVQCFWLASRKRPQIPPS